MNDKYTYGEKDVSVYTDNDIVSREYVDNFDDILKVENNIEILENDIKLFENALDRKSTLKNLKMVIYILVVITAILSSLILIPNGILSSLGVFGLIGVVGTAMTRAVIREDVGKKTIEKLKNKISVSKFQQKQEKKTLSDLKEKSKKVEIPKYKETKLLSTTYRIINLRNKLSIVQKFKKAPNLFVDKYNSGKMAYLFYDLDISYLKENVELIKYLIDEYEKEQLEKENVKGKTKSKNRR